MTDAIGLRLRALRDIEGVLGSFLIGERGELLGRDVPAACGPQVLQLIGGKLQQLCDAFVSASVGGPFESTTLCFPQYKLQVRALGGAFLAAVLAADVNLPALKMAMNMLARQLVQEIARLAPIADSSYELPRHSARPEPAPRSYRGRPVSG